MKLRNEQVNTFGGTICFAVDCTSLRRFPATLVVYIQREIELKSIRLKLTEKF